MCVFIAVGRVPATAPRSPLEPGAKRADQRSGLHLEIVAVRVAFAVTSTPPSEPRS